MSGLSSGMEPEEEGDHAEEVEMFCAVTGAVAHVAEHYLSGRCFQAHAFILNLFPGSLMSAVICSLH